MTKIADESCRFGGFDRGDTGRDDSFDAEAYLAEPPAPKPSPAKRVLASLGLFAGRSLTGLPNLNSMLPQFAGQHTTDKLRRNQRKLCRELGHRQYRRATRRSYALRDSLTVG